MSAQHGRTLGQTDKVRLHSGGVTSGRRREVPAPGLSGEHTGAGRQRQHGNACAGPASSERPPPAGAARAGAPPAPPPARPRGRSSEQYPAARRRFQRLAGGADRVALADFQALPELAGHPLAPRILALADKDRDGYLRLADFTAAVGELGRLHTDDDRAACTRPPAAAVHVLGPQCPCGAGAPVAPCSEATLRASVESLCLGAPPPAARPIASGVADTSRHGRLISTNVSAPPHIKRCPRQQQ